MHEKYNNKINNNVSIVLTLEELGRSRRNKRHRKEVGRRKEEGNHARNQLFVQEALPSDAYGQSKETVHRRGESETRI